jgi:hypothetical protein
MTIVARLCAVCVVLAMSALAAHASAQAEPRGSDDDVPLRHTVSDRFRVDEDTAREPIERPPDLAPARPRRDHLELALNASGVALLCGPWLLNVVGSLLSGLTLGLGDRTSAPMDSPGRWDTFRYTGLLPIVGPWIQLGIHPNGSADEGWTAWLVLDGLLQDAGFVLLLVAAITGSHRAHEAGAAIAILPSVGHDHAGLTAVGRF